MAYTASTPPVIISLAGSDSFAGAGIQADLKTAHSLNVYCATVITAITAQNSQGVHGVQTITPALIIAQLDALKSDLGNRISAIKIGMLGDAQTTTTVAQYLQTHFANTPIVLDTVMKATSGGQLLDSAGRDAMIKELLPMASIITPNLIEVGLLLNQPAAKNIAQMQTQAEALITLGARAVLLKGGHRDHVDATDILTQAAHPTQHQHFSAPRIDTHHTHGTGCTLSTAIAAHLAKGETLSSACENAKQYVTHIISNAQNWQLVDNNGPLAH